MTELAGAAESAAEAVAWSVSGRLVAVTAEGRKTERSVVGGVVVVVEWSTGREKSRGGWFSEAIFEEVHPIGSRGGVEPHQLWPRRPQGGHR